MKHLVKTMATTAVVLSALAGCASRSSGGSSTSAAGAGSGTSSSTSSSSTSAPGSAPSTSPSSAGQTGVSTPGDAGTVKFVSPQGVVVEKDGITLSTEVSWGGCNDQPQLVVTSQDATKVVVELKTISHFRTGMMCPNFARNGQATVKLDAPLGSRQVIDGVKNAAISVG